MGDGGVATTACEPRTAARIRYRAGNPLARVARDGHAAFDARGKNRLGILRSALLSALPRDEGGHGKWPMRRILTVFLTGASSLDDAGMEQAAYALELERLRRARGPREFKAFPDADTVYQRLRDTLPAEGLTGLLDGLLAASLAFAAKATGHVRGRRPDLAFDTHKAPIYPRKKTQPRKHPDWRFLSADEKEALARDDYRRDAIGTKDFRGTKQCIAHATLQTTGPHRYTLSSVNMRDVGNSFAKALDACLRHAESSGLRFGALFCDREGSNPSTVRVAAKYVRRGLIRSFTLAAKKDTAVKAALATVAWQNLPGKVGWQWFKIEEFPLAKGLSPTLAGVRHLVEVRDAAAKHGVRHEYQTFLFWTNQTITADTVYEASEEYRGRWGIETGYRQVEYGFPATQTTSRRIRRFLFVIRLVLLNLQTALEAPESRGDLPEFPPGRKVTLARVRIFLARALEKWVREGEAAGVAVAAAAVA